MAAKKRKRRPARLASTRPRLDALPGGAGYLLTVGPAILWLDPAAADDVLRMLRAALQDEQDEHDEPAPKVLSSGAN